MITEKQHEILSLISARTQFEGDCTDGRVTRFWVPIEKYEYCASIKKEVAVIGSGFVSSLKSMCRKGWIRQESKELAHAYSITEEGCLQIEKFREATGFYK